MATKSTSPEQDNHNRAEQQSDDQTAQETENQLMPKEYYEQKYPWFGSQIRYTIDVFRYTIKEYKRKKALSSKAESE